MKIRLAAVILILALAMSGCSAKETDTGVTADTYVLPPQEQMPEIPEAQPKETVSLSFVIDGVEEKVPAYIYEGMDYTVIVPEGGWHMYEPGAWCSTFNQKVAFRIKGYSGETLESLTADLSAEGYTYRVGSKNMTRTAEEGLIEHVMIYRNDKSLKGLFYSYPEDLASSFGVRLDTIINTFTWKDPAEDATSGSRAGIISGSEPEALPELPADAVVTDESLSPQAAQVAAIIADAEAKSAALEEKLQQAMTQADMNVISADIYTVWDDAINAVWNVLKDNLDANSYTSVLNDQIAWIGQKESAVQAAAAEYQGGSMAVLAANQKGSEMTRDRIYFLQGFIN